jgi:hypothetical protein
VATGGEEVRHTAHLVSPQQAHAVWSSLWASTVKPALVAGQRLICEIKEPTRTTEQNARLWASLTDISEQVEWYGKRLTPEDWKHVFTSSLRRLEVVPNLDGTGFVALGLSTSRMTKSEMADLLALIDAFGAEHDVTFQEEGN